MVDRRPTEQEPLHQLDAKALQCDPFFRRFDTFRDDLAVRGGAGVDDTSDQGLTGAVPVD